MAQVITLPHRADRRALFAPMAEAEGLRYTFVDGVKAETPRTGCVLAHKACIRRAKEAGELVAFIMEDDAFFTAPGAYAHYLAHVPKTFDLYLGGVYGCQRVGTPGSDGRAGVTRVKQFCGTHCYLVAAAYYDALLALPEHSHIDHLLSQQGGDFVVCEPFVCMQRNGLSDDTGKYEAYGEWGKDKWFRG